MKIDEATFDALEPCMQVRIYTDVGQRILSTHHIRVGVPGWMDLSIARAPRNAVASCIGEEGLYRLRLLDAQLYTRDEVSRAVHVLMNKAMNLKAMTNPLVNEFAHEAVCHHELEDSPGLIFAYWYGSEHAVFQSSEDEDRVQLMRAELCE
jgi:hypothetical protein